MLGVVKSLGPNKTLIAVTNEVGLGIVPAYPLGRLYRDTLGYVNQRLAQAADRVYLMVAGLAGDIKGLDEQALLLVRHLHLFDNANKSFIYLMPEKNTTCVFIRSPRSL